ncbi:DUF4199 domain-containing protein [Flavobacterium sp.]|uniref:DUF4199 domain-containing protein n=1 Tax=Flavobacterium sp. TaxID=239 RepID=UPI002FD8ED56
MKKIVLTYGLIAGAIVTAFMIYASYTYYHNTDFKPNEVIGYTGMLIAFAFVFIGVKKYRDQENDNAVSFWQAFKVGALIALLASCIYVGVWLIEYYCFFPDFMDKYAKTAIDNMKTTEMSVIEIKIKTDEINMYREWYKNPVMVILLTFMEILPLGIVVALLSAVLLKRKAKAV